MPLGTYVAASVALLAGAFLVFQVAVKRTYLRRGRLGAAGGLLQALIWLPFFLFPYLYNPPDWAWFWAHEPPAGAGLLALALILLLFGLVVLVASMRALGLAHSIGRTASRLEERGPYRWTRNPQIVGGLPLVAGLALLRPSWFAAGWVILYLGMAHMMVLAEEAHLRGRHGDAYGRYCARVPRYLGRPRG